MSQIEQAEGSLVRMAQGDRSAFLDCVRQFGSMVSAIAARAIADRHDREDLVQEIFFEVWQKAAKFDALRGSELAFIATLARRRVIDRIRQRGRSLAVENGDADVEQLAEPTQGSSEAGRQVEEMDELVRVRKALDQLRPEERQVIELSILEGASQAQIAEQLQTPLGTVKSLARRGLSRLRELVSSTSSKLPSSNSSTDWKEQHS